MSVPRKTVSKPDETTEEPTAEVYVPVKSEDQIRSEIAAEYETRLALLEAKLISATAESVSTDSVVKPSNNYRYGINPNDLESANPQGDVLVHFVEDGFTVGSSVYYRGQECFLPEAQANMSGKEQIIRYGARYFRVGPWDGESYDLSDPNLTDAERAKLARIVAEQSA